VACAIADVDADSLNDVVITHNDQPGTSPTPVACTRALKQKGSGVSVNFSKIVGWMPGPASASDDDWRGDSIALPDLDADLYRDLVIALDGPIPNGRTFSTRILMQDTVNKKMVDRTDTLLTGVLPAGDVGLAKFVLGQDVDRDGDGDVILCTPTTAGTGNRMTRFLLNAGKDPVSGLPVLMDASVLLPDFASDPGNAVTVLAADIDGDGDNDLIVTDTHVSGGTVRRTRIWRQRNASGSIRSLASTATHSSGVSPTMNGLTSSSRIPWKSPTRHPRRSRASL
jgi:hypothetical protein